MATLAELRLAIFPAASEVAPVAPVALERDVGWVRVLRARVPAFDALEAGDVAILPPRALAVIAPGDSELATLIDALAAGAVAAVLLPEPADEPASPWILAALAAGADDALPAFRVPGADPTVLERSIIGFLLNRRAELDHQAARLEASLGELALRSAELESLVAAIAGFFGRAVALEGPRGELVAIHAPPDAPGAPAAVAAYLGGSRAAALRVALPGALEGGSGPAPGRLALLGDRPASELERAAGPRIGRLLALELARSAAVRRAGDASRRETLPADGPPWVVLVARQVGPTAEREAMRADVARLAPRRQLLLRGDAESLELRAVIAVTGEGSGPAADAEDGVARRVADLLGRSVAVSRPFGDPGGRPVAEAEARTTLETIDALPAPPRVASADRLPAYRLLAALRSLPDGRRHAEALLAPILGGQAEARRERLATLRAALELPGLQEAADHLGIHRNTLAYRLRRIEAISGWRLSDRDLRLALAIAARLVQFDEEMG